MWVRVKKRFHTAVPPSPRPRAPLNSTSAPSYTITLSHPHSSLTSLPVFFWSRSIQPLCSSLPSLTSGRYFYFSIFIYFVYFVFIILTCILPLNLSGARVHFWGCRPLSEGRVICQTHYDSHAYPTGTADTTTRLRGCWMESLVHSLSTPPPSPWPIQERRNVANKRLWRNYTVHIDFYSIIIIRLLVFCRC